MQTQIYPYQQGSITKEIEKNDYWLGKQWSLTKETVANEDLITNI